MVQGRKRKFRPHQCPSCAYFMDMNTRSFKGFCSAHSSNPILVDNSNRDCKNYKNLEVYKKERNMRKAKCYKCGEEKKSWEEAERRGWREWGDGSMLCLGCKINHDNQGRNMHYHKYVQQGRRW